MRKIETSAVPTPKIKRRAWVRGHHKTGALRSGDKGRRQSDFHGTGGVGFLLRIVRLRSRFKA